MIIEGNDFLFFVAAALKKHNTEKVQQQNVTETMPHLVWIILTSRSTVFIGITLY